MAYTYNKLATYTVGSGGVPVVSFLNIPQTYQDLVIRMSARSDTGGTYGAGLQITFNFNSSGIYNNVNLTGYGSNVAGTWANTNATSLNTGPVPSGAFTANTFGNTEYYIPNYAGRTYKSMSTENTSENNSATVWQVVMGANLITTTEPITSVSFAASSSFWVQHSTFHLYGIKAEI